MAESSSGGFSFNVAARRMLRIMLALTIAGVIGFAMGKGIAWSASFLVGAVLAMASFRYTVRFVRAVGPNPETNPSPAKALLVGMRYLFLAALIYVLVQQFGLQVAGALLGLLVAAAATLLEMIYQLATFRHRGD